MLPVYLGSLALGGLLIVASIFLGGGDHDGDLDADADIDADIDVDADVDVDLDADLDLDGDFDHDLDLDGDLDGDLDHDLDGDFGHGDLDHGGLDKDLDLVHMASDTGGGTWLPFLSMRFWTFALAVFGATGALLQLVGFGDMVAAPTSALTGVGVGWGVAWAFRKLKKDRVSGNVGLHSLSGQEGRLLLPVGPGKLGKVRLLVDGQDVDLPARTRDDRLLAHHESVLVVQVKDGVAEVTSLGRSRP